MTQNSCRAILFCLSREEGVTQLELSRRAGLKPPTVSVALRRLEEEGYIVRESDVDDKRASRVFLSEKGHALEKENKERFERVDNEMMRGFSEEERDILRSMLLRIRDNLSNPKDGEE
jgi:DNA-binding MarR family transcriptional regulator